ncbi:MAG: transglutaminase family protein [Acidobacteriaceae bacterium]
MTPATTDRQIVEEAALIVTPDASHRSSLRDYFGTIVEWFEVLQPHDALDVIAGATVQTRQLASPPPDAPGIDQSDQIGDPWAVEYVYPSPMVSWNGSVDDSALRLRRGTVVETILEVSAWLHSSLTYEPGSTVVGTSVAEVLAKASGVCQDYAHAACALLRSLQIPARYVSGYFAPREIGPGEEVDAQSHAWVEAFVPGWGWWGIDPTNDNVAGERHIKVGHGRDYSDVVPFHGVHSGTAAQTLSVHVTIQNIG